MEGVFNILSQAGSSAIVGLMFVVYMFFDSKKKAQTLVIKDDERSDKLDIETNQEHRKESERLVVVETLFKEHCSAQAESFATIHNGLNTQANATKDLAKVIADYNTKLEVLTALFNERLPKK